MNEKDKKIWDELRSWFLESIDLNVYNEYLKNAYLKSINLENYNIVIKSKGYAFEILEKEIPKMEKKLEEIIGRKGKIHLITDSELEKEILIKKPKNKKPLQTFDNFIVGESNKAISSVAKKIANNPYESEYSPFFIFGSSGLGKTHLINAMEKMLNDNGFSCYKNTAIEFRSQYGKAAKDKNFSELEKIVENDVFIIDDINLITKNKSHETLNYFFYLLSHFIENSKQIIITSDVHPNELTNIEDRIRSRLLNGLSMVMKKPDEETAKSIIKFWLGQRETYLNDEIITFIVKNYGNNIREMNGLINSLSVAEIQGEIDPKNVTLEEFKKIINIPVNMVSREGDIKGLFLNICNYLNVRPEEMTGSLKIKTISTKRSQIIWLLRELSPNSTLKDIGSVLGGRDHSTINSALKKINKSMQEDKVLMNSLMKHKKNIINTM